MKNKWKIQMELKEDKYQFKLCENGIKPNTSPLARITTINYGQNVFCPFCLHKDSISKFMVNKRLGICPECKNGMLIETLIRMLKWSAEDYAKFVFEYPYAHFWSKCEAKFHIWKQRLYHLNMSNDFWLVYKKLKEREECTENVEDMNDLEWQQYLEKQKPKAKEN